MDVERIPVDPLGAGRDEWLALRMNDVTASDAAALLGAHPYKTAFGLWAEKTGRAPADGQMSEAMERGIELEPLARRWISKKNPTWQVEEPKAYYRDPAVRLGATPDCYAIDPPRPGFGVVQIKSVEPSALRNNWKTPDGDIEPPLYATVQAIIEAELTGATWAAVAALVVSHGIHLHIVEVPIHRGIIDKVRAAVDEFWRMVRAGEEPKPDYGRDGKIIARMYADEHGTEIDLSHDNRLPEIVADRARRKALVKGEEEAIAAIDTEVKAKLGHHSVGRLSDGSVITFKTTNRKGYTVEPTSYRALRYPKISVGASP